jgi:MFS family permease
MFVLARTIDLDLGAHTRLVSARVPSGNVVERHPVVAGLLLLLFLGLWVDTDVRRLVAAVSRFGWQIGTAAVAGAALGVASVGLIAWWIIATTRADRARRYDRSCPANRWRRGAAAAWVVACLAAVLATHYPPRFHTAEQWQLTNWVGVAAVAYLLVPVLALMVVVIVILVVMPMMIKWENAVRRRKAVRKHHPVD